MNLFESRTAKYLRETVGQITMLVKSLNRNQKAISIHSESKKKVMAELEKLMTQYQDKEFMATLSPPEKQALITNAQNYSRTMQELDKELDYLDMGKYAPAIYQVLASLDEAHVTIDCILTDVLVEDGSIAYAKLSSIKPEKFFKASYKNQLTSLESELDILLTDFTDALENVPDGSDLITRTEYAIFRHLLMLSLKRIGVEIERLANEKEEETKAIPVPEMVIPEIPEAQEEPETKK